MPRIIAQLVRMSGLVILLSLPVFLQPLHRVIFLSALVLAIAALGYNLLYRTGLVSFGHAVYFGLGAEWCLATSPRL